MLHKVLELRSGYIDEYHKYKSRIGGGNRELIAYLEGRVVAIEAVVRVMILDKNEGIEL